MYKRIATASVSILFFTVILISCTKVRFTGLPAQPVLEITVVELDPLHTSGPWVNHCMVKVYKTEQDFNLNINAVDSGITSMGKISFLLDSSRYWFRCIRGCQSNDLFNNQTFSALTRYRLNKQVVTIAWYTETTIKNTLTIDFAVYAVYGNEKMYVGELTANSELETRVPSTITAFVLEERFNPNIRKTYPLRLNCVDSTVIEVL
jgi:hypothetical protein